MEVRAENCFKIIAAYPPIQGIPNITDEDIAYIVANPESKVECAIDMVKWAVTGKKDIQINGGFIQLIRPTSRKIEIEFGTECPHCHETIEGVAPVQAPHPEPLFTKEDMANLVKHIIFEKPYSIKENEEVFISDNPMPCLGYRVTPEQYVENWFESFNSNHKDNEK